MHERTMQPAPPRSNRKDHLMTSSPNRDLGTAIQTAERAIIQGIADLIPIATTSPTIIAFAERHAKPHAKPASILDTVVRTAKQNIIEHLTFEPIYRLWQSTLSPDAVRCNERRIVEQALDSPASDDARIALQAVEAFSNKSKLAIVALRAVADHVERTPGILPEDQVPGYCARWRRAADLLEKPQYHPDAILTIEDAFRSANRDPGELTPEQAARMIQ